MQEEQFLLMLKMMNKKKEAKEQKKMEMVHNLNILPEGGSIFYD